MKIHTRSVERKNNNMKDLFQAPAQIEGISTMKDRTLKLKIYISQELTPEEKASLFDLEQKEGWFVFKENEIEQKDIVLPDFKPEYKGQKSPAQTLRGVYFLQWEKESPAYREKYPFELFYNIKYGKIIESEKEKLNN